MPRDTVGLAPSLRARRRGSLLALGVVTSLVAGCVEQDPPGVAIERVAADIVFGVEITDGAPANTVPFTPAQPNPLTYLPQAPGGSRPAPQYDDYDVPPPRPPRGVQFPRANLPPTPIGTPRSPCPPAALTAFPDKEAGLDLAGTPAEGLYRWKRDGKQTLAALPGVEIPIAGFESRIVRNIVKASDTEFTFETIQPELGTGITVISTFKVKTNGTKKTVEPPLQSLPVAPPDLLGDVDLPTVPSRTVGDPERGISLKRIQRIDEAGNSAVVEYTPAVLYLPLPIVAGESWESVGVDQRSGQVLQHQGQVRTRERVDACGKVIDGWSVQSTQTFSGSTSATRTYNYIFATQLGGLMIAEKVAASSAAGSTEVTFSIAQQEPSPLPASKG